MIGFAGAVEFEQLPVFRGHSCQPGPHCKLLRLFRRGHCFREAAGFRIGSGQRPNKQGLAIMSQFTRALGQPDCLSPIAKLVIATGC